MRSFSYVDNPIRRASQGDIALGQGGGREGGRQCGKKADKPRRQPCKRKTSREDSLSEGRESERHCGKKADKPRRQPCSGKQTEKTHCLRGGRACERRDKVRRQPRSVENMYIITDETPWCCGRSTRDNHLRRGEGGK